MWKNLKDCWIRDQRFVCESCVKVLQVIVNWTFWILIFIKCIYLRLFQLKISSFLFQNSNTKDISHEISKQASLKQVSKKANSQSIDRKINGKSSTNNRFNTIALKTVKNVNKNSISNSILQMVSWCCYGCCCCCYCYCCYCCKQQLLIEFKCSKKKLEKFIN